MAVHTTSKEDLIVRLVTAHTIGGTVNFIIRLVPVFLRRSIKTLGVGPGPRK